MENKKQLLLMISAIEKGLKSKDKEKVKRNIVKFIKMKELKQGTEKGFFLDLNMKPIPISYFENQNTEMLIDEFKKGLKSAKDFIKNS